MAKAKKHDVRIDRVGPNGRPRYTCYTDGKTIVCQPYMGMSIWADEVKKFILAHPPAKPLKDDGWRG